MPSAQGKKAEAKVPAAAPRETVAAADTVFPVPAPPPLPEGDPYAGEFYPTFVPRNPGIKDGEWNSNDAAIVKQAQRDADAVISAKNPDAKGERRGVVWSTGGITGRPRELHLVFWG